MENFDELLKKYADFIVRVGVNPQPGQTLIINCPLEGAPLARLCVRMELGSEEALTDHKPWQLRRYLDYAESEGGVCVLHLIADDPELYAGLDGNKISRVNAARRAFMEEWQEYTMNDRVQWSIAALPSVPWAKKIFPELDADAAMEALWKLIFDVCRVTGGDPVGEWQAHMERLSALRDKMNALDLESVHFESSNGTDLTVGLADQAVWESAASKSEKGVVFLPNIPTEEVFTAPHKDKVEGVVYGTKPYVFNGQLIKNFRVTFEKGRVVDYHAEQGQLLLGRLLDGDEGSRSIGEVALVPASSPINRSGKLFYSTLFDENAACHIAFGASYPGTTKGGTALSKEELLARGMNQSHLHEDVMIGAEDSHITGKCRDGRTVQGPRFLFVWRFFMAKQSGGNTAQRVEALVRPTVEGMGLRLWDVVFEKEGPDWYLRVLIDKDGTMDTDTCADVSHALDPILDEADPIDQSYYLEVGSPGLGRKLTRPEHYEALKGQKVRVKLIRPNADGVREFAGILTGREGSTVTVETDAGAVTFEVNAAASVNLCDDEDLFD